MGNSRRATAYRASSHMLRRSKVMWLGLSLVAGFLFVACGGSATATSDGGPKPADRSADAAADFELRLFENENHAKGQTIRLSQLRGRPVVLNFWFPSCPPCRAEMPDLQAAFQKYGPDGVEFIGVQQLGLDTAEDGQDFVDEIGVTYAIGPDEASDIIRAYNVTNFPTTLFIDRNQNIFRKWAGFLNADVLDDIIPQLLN